MASRAALLAVRRAPAARPMAVRRFGAPGGAEAHPFGIKPGTYKREGWESVVYPCYIASTVLLVVGLSFKPRNDLKIWATDEAAARLKRMDEGEPIEFGKHYGGVVNKFPFAQEELGEPVIIGEVDEDDDE
mmetsp:Transcript_30578/g.62417  ORF Transcript_30578/g.62417 Transcript_30578/m.62417 type:complete len:131 (-) Transcript_30578:125-517(-)